MILLLLACGDGMNNPGSSGSSLLIVDYDGMVEENTWVYRDDGDTGMVDESTLLQSKVVSEGVVEFRRGARWADAAPVGDMVWDLSSGLALTSWSLFGGGSGNYLLSDFDPEAGEVYSDGSWSCAVSIPSEQSTWYGTFQDVITVSCEDGGVLEGRYVFARDVGLVRLELTSGQGLNLVAPW